MFPGTPFRYAADAAAEIDHAQAEDEIFKKENEEEPTATASQLTDDLYYQKAATTFKHEEGIMDYLMKLDDEIDLESM